MELLIKYNYENCCGVFTVERIADADTFDEIVEQVNSVKEMLVEEGNKPLTYEVIFK